MTREDRWAAAVARAVDRLAEAFPNFPSAAEAMDLISSSIKSFVEDETKLSWLVMAACNTMRFWSLAELRGLYCSRYEPKDGVYVEAETPGFRPDDIQATWQQRRVEIESAEYEAKVKQWRRELGAPTEPPKLLPPGTAVMPSSKSGPRVVPPPKRRTAEELMHAGGGKRTPEENERLARELEERIRRRLQKEGA